jgi:hypothetical protein
VLGIVADFDSGFETIETGDGGADFGAATGADEQA